MKKLFQYLFGIILFLVGGITIILGEPIYGLGIILLGLLLIPLSSNFLTRSSAKLKSILFIGISLLLILTISMFGRKKYDRTENLTSDEISSLSIHPVKKIKVNKLDYYYIEKGQGETILLLHGFPDMANTWDETIQELSKTRRVIAPFLRGYYPTGIPEDQDYSVKTIAGDMVKLMNNLNVENFIVVGQDWGASISYAVANLAENSVSKMVSIAIPHPTCLLPTPQLLYAGRHFFLFGTGNYGVRYARKKDFEYIDRLYQRWSPDYVDYQKSSEAIKETFKFPNRLEAALGYYTSFASDQSNVEKNEFYQTIPNIPILFLVGENDDIATEQVVQSMKTKMPEDSRTIVFENAGHFLHREIFQEFIAELKLFLNEE